MTYDIIIIGTGPGGYVCAIRAALYEVLDVRSLDVVTNL